VQLGKERLASLGALEIGTARPVLSVTTTPVVLAEEAHSNARLLRGPLRKELLKLAFHCLARVSFFPLTPRARDPTRQAAGEIADRNADAQHLAVGGIGRQEGQYSQSRAVWRERREERRNDQRRRGHTDATATD
jgi:hypothetical protein